MKKFCFKILLIITPFIVLSYPVDLWLSTTLQKSNEAPGEFEVMNDIYSGELDCDIAIYGSSRAWVHVDPTIIQNNTNLKAYNFGIDGHNFWMQYLRHLEYLKHNKKPAQIIMSVDVFTFQKEANLYYKNQFLPYLLWNKNIQKYTSSYNGFHFLEYYIPAIRYIGENEIVSNNIHLAFINDKITKYRKQGYKGMDLEWNNDFEKAREEMSFFEVEIHQASIELFQQFIDECKAMNIKVQLVYAPEHISGQQFVSNRKEIFEIFNAIAQKNDLLFLDYSENELCFNKAYFYNASHLNLKGAEIFTNLLIKDLNLAQ